MPPVGVPAPPWMWAKARSKLAALKMFYYYYYYYYYYYLLHYYYEIVGRYRYSSA
jgi:hypothetical protein